MEPDCKQCQEHKGPDNMVHMALGFVSYYLRGHYTASYNKYQYNKEPVETVPDIEVPIASGYNLLRLH